ncbi:MAG: hypothetical protein ACI4QL_01175, partial [Candidatus Fimimonas sp.]
RRAKTVGTVVEEVAFCPKRGVHFQQEFALATFVFVIFENPCRQNRSTFLFFHKENDIKYII